MADHCLVDGEPAALCPTDDRGLAYGDGVFRTLRITHGRPEAWAVHMTRLADDCARLGLPRPDADRLDRDARSLSAGLEASVLKIVVTRGSGGRGYTPAQAASVRRIVSRHELPAHARGTPPALALDWSPVALARQPLLAGIKHLNRLEQVLARADCQRRGAADAAMHDSAGWLISTTMRNLLLRDFYGRWWTPQLDQAGVAGATRQRLMHGLARNNQPVTACAIAVDGLATFDAVVACNSVGGVSAVQRIGETVFAHSESAAGICRRLLAAF